MKISVIIPTRNRKDRLRITINEFLLQTWNDKEIIVVDNASEDGTQIMMQEEFPEIKYVRFPDNFDIKAINYGIEISSGDIIWRTDDDSNPEHRDNFEKVVKIFENHQDIDIISMENLEANQNYQIGEWYPLEVDKKNVPDIGYKAHAFAGSGAAIRRKVFNAIGGFWGYGFEEIEFCTRAILAGYNVRYFPNIRVNHFAQIGTKRDPSWRWIRISLQLVRYNWKYFPSFLAFRRFLLIYFVQILYGIKQKVKFTGIMEGIFGMIATSFRTIREERIKIDKNKIKDITLGVSQSRSYFVYFRDSLKRKFRK